MSFLRKSLAAFQKAIRNIGLFGLFRVSLYPVFTFFTTPVRLMQFLWASRLLLDGRWGDYPHFSPHMGILSLFYWTRALNLYRFGRYGRSPYLGLGDFRLSRDFQYSLPSLYAYWFAGAPTVVIGMTGWWLSHTIWLSEVDVIVAIGVMGLALISPLFYINLARQNYNVLGWMFFSIGLFGLMTEQWTLAAVAWLVASFGSFTVVFMGGIFSLALAVFSWSIYPMLAFLPAALKLATHFWPSIYNRDLTWILMGMARAIGLVEWKAKYKRAASKRLNFHRIYLLLTYIQFLFAAYVLGGKISIIFLIGVLIFLVNAVLFRFADEQSVYMLMFSLGTAVTLQISQPTLLVFYWILVSPAPRLLAFPGFTNVYDIVPRLSPFSIRPFLDGMENFLSPVCKGQRVFMAFDDPGGEYESLFDGQKLFLELLSYAATLRGIHYIPDWWAVFELNDKDAPDFWGRDVPSTFENCKRWGADYVVVYQEEVGTALDPKWELAGFRQAGQFAWSDYEAELKPGYKGTLPDWWLLKAPNA